MFLFYFYFFAYKYKKYAIKVSNTESSPLNIN